MRDGIVKIRLFWWLSGKEFTGKYKLDLWVRKIPREGNGNTLQYSYLGNPMDRGAWWATVHKVTKESQKT